jgi:Holliday junction resolvase RusA-like endonuclease
LPFLPRQTHAKEVAKEPMTTKKETQKEATSVPNCVNLPLSFIIKGEPRTKKNSQRIMRNKAGRSFIIPSQQYQNYEKSFIEQAEIEGVTGLKIADPVNIKCLFYMHTRRKVDLTNLLSGAMDCMVSAGIIEDDNCKIATANDGSRVFYDKENPRTEITIERINASFCV